jgi:hypothetical protein
MNSKVRIDPSLQTNGSLKELLADDPIYGNAEEELDVLDSRQLKTGINTWTDHNIQVTSSIGRMNSSIMRWVKLNSTNEILKGDMLKITGNNGVRMIVIDHDKEKGYLLKLISTTPGEIALVNINEKTGLKPVDEPIPKRTSNIIVPVVRKIKKKINATPVITHVKFKQI